MKNAPIALAFALLAALFAGFAFAEDEAPAEPPAEKPAEEPADDSAEEPAEKPAETPAAEAADVDPAKLLADLEAANKAKDLTAVSALLDSIAKVGETAKDSKSVDGLAKELGDSFKLAKGNWGTLRKIVDTLGALRSKHGGKILKRIAFDDDVEDPDEMTVVIQALLAIGMLADKRYLDPIIDQSKHRETTIAEGAYKALANYGVAKGNIRKAVAEELMKRLEAEYPYSTGKDSATPGAEAIKRWETLQGTIVKSMQAICHEPTITTVPNWREWWKENKKSSKAWKDKKD